MLELLPSDKRITCMGLIRVFSIALGTAFMLAPGASSVMRAQTASDNAGKPKFEVASVRQNMNDDGKVMFGIQPGGRFNAHNMPLWELIRQAYAVQRTQLVGMPDWAETARYDITAKAEGDIPRAGPGAPAGPLNFMMQDLLADRFKLRAHRETREMPTYALMLARSDEKLGAGLRASTVDCAAVMRGRGGRGAPAPGPPPPGERPACGMRVAPNQVLAGGVPLAQLTQMLSQFTQRIVVDRTGLDGIFDIDLTFTPDRLPQGPPPPGAPPLPSIDPNGPSLFTAVQEQLGLRLESERAPVEVLVIDHVERPTPD
jgi:uncharacterized protein (TIGR03435 family)